MRSHFCKSSVPAIFLLLNGVANYLNYELWSHVWLFSSLFFSSCEACQHYCFQLVYVLVAEIIFCKTVSNIRNTGRLTNMYSEMQWHSYVKKSPYQRAVMVCIKYFLIESLKIHSLNCKLFSSLSFQIDFLSEGTFTSPERKCILSLTQVILLNNISLQHLHFTKTSSVFISLDFRVSVEFASLHWLLAIQWT